MTNNKTKSYTILSKYKTTFDWAEDLFFGGDGDDD